MKVSRTGVEGTNVTTSSFQALQPEAAPLPDVLGELQNRTQLTRRSLARILADSGRLDDLRLNPAGFLDQAADLINRAKRAALVAGVSYQSLPDQDAYAQELFGLEEIKGYLGRMIEVQKSVTEAVPYDSEIEQVFAAKLNASEAVRVFAKLPDWFIVPTPLGGYNPDWAVLAQTTEGEKLFFVVETKGTELKEDLRLDERDRIDCGGKHFEALAKAVGDGQPQFRQERSADRLLASLAAPSTGGPAIST
jgi:type III restriction enzyme